MSHRLQALSQKAKNATEYIQGLKGLTDAVGVSTLLSLLFICKIKSILLLNFLSSCLPIQCTFTVCTNIPVGFVKQMLCKHLSEVASNEPLACSFPFFFVCFYSIVHVLTKLCKLMSCRKTALNLKTR